MSWFWESLLNCWHSLCRSSIVRWDSSWLQRLKCEHGIWKCELMWENVFLRITDLWHFWWWWGLWWKIKQKGNMGRAGRGQSIAIVKFLSRMWVTNLRYKKLSWQPCRTSHRLPNWGSITTGLKFSWNAYDPHRNFRRQTILGGTVRRFFSVSHLVQEYYKAIYHSDLWFHWGTMLFISLLARV